MTLEEHDTVDLVFAHKDQELERLKALLTRAADALKLEHSERTGLPDKNAKGCSICNLIIELRKASAR